MPPVGVGLRFRVWGLFCRTLSGIRFFDSVWHLQLGLSHLTSELGLPLGMV